MPGAGRLKILCSKTLDNIMAIIGTIRIPFPNTSIKNENKGLAYAVKGPPHYNRLVACAAFFYLPFPLATSTEWLAGHFSLLLLSGTCTGFLVCRGRF